jgi:hypothetical protein
LSLIEMASNATMPSLVELMCAGDVPAAVIEEEKLAVEGPANEPFTISQWHEHLKQLCAAEIHEVLVKTRRGDLQIHKAVAVGEQLLKDMEAAFRRRDSPPLTNDQAKATLEECRACCREISYQTKNAAGRLSDLRAENAIAHENKTRMEELAKMNQELKVELEIARAKHLAGVAAANSQLNEQQQARMGPLESECKRVVNDLLTIKNAVQNTIRKESEKVETTMRALGEKLALAAASDFALNSQAMRNEHALMVVARATTAPPDDALRELRAWVTSLCTSDVLMCVKAKADLLATSVLEQEKIRVNSVDEQHTLRNAGESMEVRSSARLSQSKKELEDYRKDIMNSFLVAHGEILEVKKSASAYYQRQLDKIDDSARRSSSALSRNLEEVSSLLLKGAGKLGSRGSKRSREGGDDQDDRSKWPSRYSPLSD